MRRLGLIIATLATATASGVAGYVVGASRAPSEGEWESVHREARNDATPLAEARSYRASRAEGIKSGVLEGRKRGSSDGAGQGGATGEASAKEELAKIAETKAALADDGLLHLNIPPGSTYSDELPNGQPGFALPEDQRSLSCVGVGLDGGCVGD